MQIQGKTVLVTGASSGIGAATAKAAAAKGARVVLIARDRSKLDGVVREIVDRGGDARAYAADCGDREAVARVAAAITTEVGTPDVIVNNAGAGRFLYFHETPPEEFEQLLAAPFLAAVYVTRAFLPDMLERGSGLIVNVNTPIAYLTWPAAAGYALARWALRGLDAVLAAELRGSGVKVSQVIPGKVSSSYFAHNPGSEQGIPGIARLIPKLTPAETAEVIVTTMRTERRLVFAPLVLRLFMLQARIFPPLTRYLAIRTSRSRPRPPAGGLMSSSPTKET